MSDRYSAPFQPLTPYEERLAERWKDDPAKEFRLSMDGIELIVDEVFDSKPVKSEPRKVSPLFKQVISDTRAHLKNIGAIKDE